MYSSQSTTFTQEPKLSPPVLQIMPKREDEILSLMFIQLMETEGLVKARRTEVPREEAKLQNRGRHPCIGSQPLSCADGLMK